MNRLCQIASILLAASILASCAHRAAEKEITPEESKEQKIENLTTALSRAQSRIEELDAKVSVLNDKLESTRLAVENAQVTSAPPKAQAIGAAAADQASNKRAAKPVAPTQREQEVLSIRVDEPSGEFSKAMALFKEGKYADAELVFNRFTEKYPEHILAGSAQFFAGESYFMLGEYNLATNEYSKVISTFSSSPRVVSAMVRLAQCYESAGAPKEAERTMTLAKQLFSGSPALELAAPERTRKAAPVTAKVATPAAPKSEELKSDVMEPPVGQPAGGNHE